MSILHNKAIFWVRWTKIKTKTISSIEIVDDFYLKSSVCYIALNQFNSNLSPFILSETVHKVVNGSVKGRGKKCSVAWQGIFKTSIRLNELIFMVETPKINGF